MNPAEYDIKTVRRLIREMNKLLSSDPTFDAVSADMIIRNLVKGLEIAANVVDQLKQELEMEARIRASTSGGGSNALN